MKVSVEVHDLRFEIACAEGTQTVKWLALAAAQRYALARPGGRSRARESSLAKQGFFVPEEITLQGFPLTDPTARISDVLENGSVLQVKLQREVELDEVGAPQLSPFAEAAFNNSEAAECRVKQAAQRQELSAREAERQAAEQKRARQLQARRGSANMSVVIAGEFESKEDVEDALAFDVDSVNLLALEREVNHESLRLVLLTHFRLLNSIFMFFCGQARPGLVFGMTFEEFCCALHVSGLAHEIRDQAVLEDIFLQSVANRFPPDARATPKLSALLSRADFIFGLVKAVKQVVPNKGQGASDELTDLLEDALMMKVEPAFQRLWGERVVAKTRERGLAQMLQDNRPHLKRVFEHHATDGKRLGLQGFKDLCERAQLLVIFMGDANFDERAEKLCHSALLSAQGDPPQERELDTLVFSQFLLALAYVSVECLEGPSPLPQKIKYGVNRANEYSLQV